jgi:hypothetical protein
MSTPETGRPRGRPAEIDWKKWIPLLGAVPDVDAAARIGCATATVYQKRKELAIASYRSKRGKNRGEGAKRKLVRE